MVHPGQDDLVAKLCAMMAEQLSLPLAEVSADTELKSLKLDSLDLEELIWFAEEDGLAPDMSEVPRNELTTIRRISEKILELKNEHQ